MATFTVTTNTTTPNGAYTRLPWVVDASDFGLPQFQYVMDVYDLEYPSVRISRSLQTPNPDGVAVFDPSRIFQGILGQDDFWKVYKQESDKTTKIFRLEFGKQYGTSASSPVTVFTNLTTDVIEIIPAVVDPNVFGTSGYNWVNPLGGKVGNSLLTNAPAAIDNNMPEEDGLYLTLNDFHTVSLGESDTVEVSVHEADDTLIATSLISIGRFGSIGVGPNNILSAGVTTPVKTALQTNPLCAIIKVGNGSGPDYKIFLPPYTDFPCEDDYTRFAFINRYGFWDYYNVFNPTKTSSTLKRQNVTLPRVDYSTSTSLYDIERRGDTQYFLSSEDEYEIDTNYVSQEMATWLEELIESPTVYIQEGEEFIPIVFTNTSYKANLSTSRNKLFKYTFTYKYASGRASRL